MPRLTPFSDDEFLDAFTRKVADADRRGCLRWTGAIGKTGYGNTKFKGRYTNAHRAAYILYYGSIPEGADLDHLCRIRWCVNPLHLEPVTRSINMMRANRALALKRKIAQDKRTHCSRGHEFLPINTYAYRGWKICRACRRSNHHRRQQLKAS